MNDKAATVHVRSPASLISAVGAALVTAPGRPEGQRALSPQRIRIWRTVVVVQACLAVVLCLRYLNGPPWPIAMWLMFLALSLPVSLLGLDSSLSASPVAP